MKIKKDDKVLIITGKNRGKTGKVTGVLSGSSSVIVEGINKQKRHVKPKKQGEKGQVVEIEAPVNISNIALVCTKCNKPTRVGYKVTDGRKQRVCKKCDKAV